MPKTIGQEIRRKTLAFEVKEVKASDDGQYAGEFTGYAAGIHNIDRTGDMILPGAFTDTISDFLKEGVVCWQHDWMTPIGVPLEASEDAYGLLTKSRISRTSTGLDCMTLIRDGVVKKLSIGYRVKDYEWVDRAGLLSYLSGSGLPDARKSAILKQYDEMELAELFLLKKIKLYEYSPVTIPANPNAIITDSKGLLAGLSFGDQLQAVLAAVKETKERAEQIKALREKEGRHLSAERKDGLRELAFEILDVADALRLLASEPAAIPDEAAQLFAQFQLLEARSLGAAA